ncbi:MAG: tRNA (adenosine(37)-N6)-dimethylallyltransferase MiaA [Candidatus Omnitrophota bacterium]
MTAPANSIIFIVGPTAIGKTNLAVGLARRIKGEIVSADSMQIYKGMKILSQAPTRKEKSEARHHLVELLDPQKEYSVAMFIKKASSAIISIISKKKIPIVVGGSGLYIKGLVDGLFPSPEADMKFRRRMALFAKKYGQKKLYAKLVRIDPDAAEKIHPNDLRRIIRALEIQYTTGKTMTELKASTRGLKDRYDIKMFGLIRPREEMYSLIDARVDKMFRGRVVAEVKRLKKKKLSKTAAAVLGFKEISSYLDGRCSREEAGELLKMNTRRFAKRQLTWFRANNNIKWFDTGKFGNAEIIKLISKEVR